MINLAICDDEVIYINEITDLIQNNIFNNMQYSIKSFKSGEELLDYVKNSIIDILFLDIEMKNLNGIETAKELKKYLPDCIIFFVTSYNNYITDVFRLNSFQFLQKPINHVDFKYDFNRALEKYKVDHTFIDVKANGFLRNISINEIYYIEVITREIRIHLKDEVVIHTGKISIYEEKLKMFGFAKTHKSYLVNLSKIECIENDSINFKRIEDNVPIGRKFKKEFMNEYHKYMIGRCI